jgi:hypothetical protein
MVQGLTRIMAAKLAALEASLFGSVSSKFARTNVAVLSNSEHFSVEKIIC